MEDYRFYPGCTRRHFSQELKRMLKMCEVSYSNQDFPRHTNSGRLSYVNKYLFSIVITVCILAPQPATALHCEAIRIPMCRSMPYNMTRLPNLLHHSTQQNAILAIEQFEVLRWTRCSVYLSFFLCAMYVPICTVEFQNEAIPPCKSVCEKARRGCEPLLNRFNISWPHTLSCSRLPRYDRGVCITPEAIVTEGNNHEVMLETVSRKTRGEDTCSCGKSARLRRHVYIRRRYEYVIQGRVQVSETFGELTLTTVAVIQVLKQSWVGIKPKTEVRLWTNSTCACPKIIPGEVYLILGHEDETNQRLLYVLSSLAVPYKQRYRKRLQKWERQLQRALRKEKNIFFKREHKKQQNKKVPARFFSSSTTSPKKRQAVKLEYVRKKNDKKKKIIRNRRRKIKGRKANKSKREHSDVKAQK